MFKNFFSITLKFPFKLLIFLKKFLNFIFIFKKSFFCIPKYYLIIKIYISNNFFLQFCIIFFQYFYSRLIIFI